MTSPTTFQFSSFVCFGREIQANAEYLCTKANEKLNSVKNNLEIAKSEVSKHLDLLDQKRHEVYTASIEPSLHLFSETQKTQIASPPSNNQKLRLETSAPSFTHSINLHSLKNGILKGIFIGLSLAIFTYVIVHSLIPLSLQLLPVILVGLFLVSFISMLMAYRTAKQNLTAVLKFSCDISIFETSVNIFIERARDTIAMSRNALIAINLANEQTVEEKDKLMVITKDTVNAASLLREITEMSLLDADGGLLSGVIDKIREKQNGVNAFQRQIHGEIYEGA